MKLATINFLLFTVGVVLAFPTLGGGGIYPPKKLNLEKASVNKDWSPPKCDPGGTQSQMDVCAKERFDKADRELNRDYKKLVSSLTETEKNFLLIEQRAWLKNRDPKCREEANDEAEGGSMWPMVYDSCRVTITKARINKLKQWKK